MDTKIIQKPIKVVMIRRGPITFRSVPVQQLFAFIRNKALLGADEPDLSVEHENFETPAHIENQFQEVADLLKEINN